MQMNSLLLDVFCDNKWHISILVYLIFSSDSIFSPYVAIILFIHKLLSRSCGTDECFP